jgi:hypothetical protein
VSEDRPGITRRKLLAGTGKAAAAAAAASAVGWIEVGNPALASTRSRSGEVGTATALQNSFEYIGQVDQAGDNLTSYGYLSLIAGLDVSQLYTDPTTPDETTARFTYFGTATLYARNEFDGVTGKLFIIDARGTVQYYFDPNGGASFSDPDSFKSGQLIASDTAEFHDVMSVAQPDTGMPHLTASLKRTLAKAFVLGGTTYRFGHVGLLQRSTATGLSIRLDPTPTSVIQLGGDAVVTGQA